MGTHHGGNDGNGGNVPPDGDRSPDPDLPELPPEWGQIEIPDDLSALAAESEQVRAELERERREGPHPGGPPTPGSGTEPSIGVPLLIMSVAVMITLVSLFAMTWSGSGTTDPDDRASTTPSELPPVALFDAAGRQVSLAGQAPLALLLVEQCDCTALLTDTVTGAPPGVTVAAVGQNAPAQPTGLAPGDPVPLLLADPTGLLRDELGLGPPTDAATVVLVDQSGQISRTYPAATSVAQFQVELTELQPPG